MTELQSRPFVARPPEELYDLQEDPDETVNLAAEEAYSERLAAMKEVLYDRMRGERDMGLIPEPILEDMGRKAGSSTDASLEVDRSGQTSRLIDVITAGEKDDAEELLSFANSEDPSTRYWAAVWLGVNRHRKAIPVLEKLAEDDTPAVRVAAAQALCKLGDDTQLKLLVEHIGDPNMLVEMFAIRAIEELGDAGKPYHAEIAEAQESGYEFTRRIARRLTKKWMP